MMQTMRPNVGWKGTLIFVGLLAAMVALVVIDM